VLLLVSVADQLIDECFRFLILPFYIEFCVFFVDYELRTHLQIVFYTTFMNDENLVVSSNAHSCMSSAFYLSVPTLTHTHRYSGDNVSVFNDYYYCAVISFVEVNKKDNKNVNMVREGRLYGETNIS